MTTLAHMRTDADIAEIRQRVQSAGSSFYWAMRFVSRAKSDALFAIYAFCREVDDIADGSASASEKMAALAVWRGRIARLYEGGVVDVPVARALAPVIPQFNLARADFEAVIAGMEMDAAGPVVAPSLATLDLYCDRVASAVGRLCIRVFGESGPSGLAVAYHLGRALQLTNILRDVVEDAGIDRLYLPAELLAARGVIVTSPRDVLRHPHICRVIGDVGTVATQAFVDAEIALAQCDARAMRPAVVMMRVYRRTLERLRAEGWRLRPPAKGLQRIVLRAENRHCKN